ncbi:MAG: hypothetical protein H0T73_20615, partial [Ardenticatenales bacterium]|nr:hypothetical protein [Ardenticatenales bacterium]
MHIALLNYAYEAAMRSPEELLERYETLTGWAQGLRLAGSHVTVWQRFHHDALLVRDSIHYHFVADGFSPTLRMWQIPWRLHQQIMRQNPDVLHINGLLFPLQSRIVKQFSPAASITIA